MTHQSATVQTRLQSNNLPCIDVAAAGFLPNKRFLFNSIAVRWMNQTVNDSYKVQRDQGSKHQIKTTSCKMVFNLHFFSHSFPSEMTGFRNGIALPLVALQYGWLGLICYYAGICWPLQNGRTRLKTEQWVPKRLIWLPPLHSSTLDGSPESRMVPEPASVGLV